MINAENKSATKHQNNAAFCLPSLFYFIYTVKIYEPIRQLERKAVFITEDRMKKKNSTLIFAIETRDFGFTMFIFNSKTREPTRCF